MSSQNPLETAAARAYASAYATHYTQGDLLAALRAYDEVIEQYPNAPEARYARAQLRNIVSRVVPAEELLASQMELVRRHLERT